MKADDHDDLWELLGHAKAPAPSPMFSRNVLRAIRLETPQQRGWLGILAVLRRPRAAWSLGLVVLSASAWMGWQQLHERQEQRREIAALAQSISSSPDYEVISQLDDLMAYEESSVWLEKSY